MDRQYLSIFLATIIVHILLELREVLDVVPERGGHDRSGVLERIADATEVRCPDCCVTMSTLSGCSQKLAGLLSHS
jgi:hypothetical protein